MLEIDGARGEGGGQVVRTSLALSVATGTPFRLFDVRARRKQPGLKPQHLASVHAAARVSGAEVVGAERGALEIVFRPAGVFPGEYHVDVGTAGSATLVVQTVLPPLLTASAPSRVVVTGGTHNAWAPPYEFLEKCFLPLLERLGPTLRSRLVRPGFVPVGGGELQVEVEPVTTLAPFELLERGRVRTRRAVAMISRLPTHVATRELGVVAKRLGWPQKDLVVREVTDARGPGNAVVLEVECDEVTEVFFEPGAIGTRAETVASRAAREARTWLDAGVPVGEHLADQLLLPLALGSGGRFRTLPLSSHAETQIDLLKLFLDVEVQVTEIEQGAVEVSIRGREASPRTPHA